MASPKAKHPVTAHLCTKAGFSPYNKSGEAEEFPIAHYKIVDTHPYREGEILICRPTIDKMEFTYNFDDCPSLKDKIAQIVGQNAHSIVNHGDNGAEELDGTNVGAEAVKIGWSHNVSIVVHLSITSFAIVQIFPKWKGPFFRCEFNPSKAGPDGVASLKQFIADLFDNPYFPISWKNMSELKKSLKRLDIAVNMLGVASCDVEGSYLKSDNTKRHVYQSTNGRTETFYFVLPKGNKDQAYWYDKEEEQENKKTPEETEDDNDENDEDGVIKKAGFGIHKNQSPCLKTRFEYRVTDTTRAIGDLGKLTNYLKKFRFRAVDYNTMPEDIHYAHGMFLRYALMRTRDKALETVPLEHQKAHSDVYDKAMVNIWDAEKIWSEGWVNELLWLGIIGSDDVPKPKKKNNIKKGIKAPLQP